METAELTYYTRGLLSLRSVLVGVKGLLDDRFITEHTGGGVDPRLITALQRVRHPGLQEHLSGPLYNRIHQRF